MQVAQGAKDVDVFGQSTRRRRLGKVARWLRGWRQASRCVEQCRRPDSCIDVGAGKRLDGVQVHVGSGGDIVDDRQAEPGVDDEIGVAALVGRRRPAEQVARSRKNRVERGGGLVFHRRCVEGGGEVHVDVGAGERLDGIEVHGGSGGDIVDDRQAEPGVDNEIGIAGLVRRRRPAEQVTRRGEDRIERGGGLILDRRRVERGGEVHIDIGAGERLDGVQVHVGSGDDIVDDRQAEPGIDDKIGIAGLVRRRRPAEQV
ncbi:hypothetical protein, partial [uncultured Sphingomonas sp.]|uniref:hypothetical protein n=1 Tax=uncultured Sphingomonas sp. TaxID=158754 RepID=UPI0025E6198C